MRPLFPRIPGRLVQGIAIALAVAGLVHLATILRLAHRPEADVYRRLLQHAPAMRLQTFVADAVADQPTPYRDPAMAEAFCLFDLGDGPVEVSLPVTPLDFAVLSVHGPDGTVLYALTNGAAVGGSIVLSLTRGGAAAGPTEAAGGVPQVGLARPEGFVMVQALAAMGSLRATAEATARRLNCRRAGG